MSDFSPAIVEAKAQGFEMLAPLLGNRSKKKVREKGSIARLSRSSIDDLLACP